MNRLWRPYSPCGPRCLPPAGTYRRAAGTAVVARLAATLAMLGVTMLTLPMLAALPAPRSRPLVRVLARGMLLASGIRHEVVGTLPDSRGLLVANHISWLDVLAILATTPARLLAKREVRGWPVIGGAAAAIGTIFIDRARPRRLPSAVAEVASALRAGTMVAVFPEGTTWCGRRTGQFRPAMFQAAIDTGTLVFPLAIEYLLIADGAVAEPTTVAAFLGEQTLLDSIRKVITAAGVTVRLRPGQPLPPDLEPDRRSLADLAQREIAALPQPEVATQAQPAAARGTRRWRSGRPTAGPRPPAGPLSDTRCRQSSTPSDQAAPTAHHGSAG